MLREGGDREREGGGGYLGIGVEHPVRLYGYLQVIEWEGEGGG